MLPMFLLSWLLFVPGADSRANLYLCKATVFPFVVEEEEEDDDDEPFEGTNFESVIIAPFVPRSHEAGARGILGYAK